MALVAYAVLDRLGARILADNGGRMTVSSPYCLDQVTRRLTISEVTGFKQTSELAGLLSGRIFIFARFPVSATRHNLL